MPSQSVGVIRVARKLIPDAYACLGWRLIMLAGALLLSGIFEGIGLAMLLPVLAKLGMGGNAAGGLPQVMGRILDIIGIPNELGPLLALAVSVLYLQIIFQTWKTWCEADCQTRYASHWQRVIFNTFIDAEWSFFTAERASSRVNMLTGEAGRIAALFYLLEQMTTSAVFVLIYGVIALAASWQMVAIFALFGGLIYLSVRPLGRRGHELGTRITAVSEALQHRASEFMQNAKLIKSTATEAVAKTLFAGASFDYRDAYRKAAFHPKLTYGAYMIAGYTLLGVGTWLAIERLHVNAAAVAVSIYVFLRLYVQLTNFHQLRHGFVLSAPALEGVKVQVDLARSLSEYTQEQGRRLPDGPAAIRFRDVTVRYEGVAALDKISFEVPAGAIVGITGASGAGKSTLVDAIVGLIRPDGGQVEVDDVPLDEVSRTDWRRSIGYVGQETLLLNGSVHENVAWGNRDDLQEIVRAAHAANAHDFIMALPKDYSAEVGDRGVRLSGGQRQRLGLARALVGTRRLLILDEATSALDSESEHEIMAALSAMRGRVTMVVVAHRLSTLRMADKILVFEQGHLVELGAWDELSRKKGVFGRLLELQTSGTSNSSGSAASSESVLNGRQ